MYEVELTSRARREFDKLPEKDQERAEAVFNRLRENPRPAGNRKLLNAIYRIRVGDLRVIYEVYDRENLVLVGRIVRRSEDTYDRLKGLF